MAYRGPRDEYKVFASRLRTALGRAGKSQIKVAEDLGFSKSMMTNYVQAKSMPESDRLYKIADYLGVDPAWLFGANVNPDGTAIDNIFAPVAGSSPDRQFLMDKARTATDEDVTRMKKIWDLIDQETSE